jgi:endoglucanase
MNRRHFLGTSSTIALGLATAPAFSSHAAENKPAPPTAKHLPRWRGFNLTEKFVKRRQRNPPFDKDNFPLLADWGFNFVRLPMSYLCWTDPADWRKIQEDELKDIDAVLEYGRKSGVHINLNFHRAPGYCVNPPKERLDLWSDSEALDVCSLHWAAFAKRYKGIPNDQLSFDLLNEPPNIAEEKYVPVVNRLVQAIRSEDPGRLIIADGLRWGRDAVHGLAQLGIAQSTRGYDPMQISHYQANWVNGSDKWALPTWPLKLGEKEVFDKERLKKERIQPWKALEQKGVGIHVGEWGAFNRTPHAVTLAWMRDCLSLWKEAGWGWALWNLHGSFGIFDSERSDVQYEDYRGHKLDREMLKVLQEG